MKFLVIKGVWVLESETGRMRPYKKGDDIELKDMETIDALVMNLQITPLDDKLVKEKATYKVRYSFTENFNGKIIRGEANKETKLTRDIAVNLMARGYIVPSDKDAWYPNKPSFQPEKPVKRMYDLED